MLNMHVDYCTMFVLWSWIMTLLYFINGILSSNNRHCCCVMHISDVRFAIWTYSNDSCVKPIRIYPIKVEFTYHTSKPWHESNMFESKFFPKLDRWHYYGGREYGTRILAMLPLSYDDIPEIICSVFVKKLLNKYLYLKSFIKFNIMQLIWILKHLVGKCFEYTDVLK